MKQFQYKVTMIVPVYNVSEYLETCLNSLLAQTMPKDQMEILLINDGSTDNSLEICERYVAQYPVFKLFSKPNEGLSATRNFGISRAQGKYMMFLDSDDTISPETMEAVTNFFDCHYDETDLVTFLDQPYKFGEKMKVHYRYQYLNHDGIFDLQEFPFISQTRVNICVKNVENNFLFDTTPGFRLEDQEYCSKVLKAKQKIGFCTRGEYQYNRSNDGSIVSNYFFAYYIFESSLAYFERLFSEFEGKVPKYYQAMYVNDLIWKHNENKLYPYHYSEEEFAKAMDRIKALLARVDADVIYNHPQLDNFNKQYWLQMNPSVHPLVQADEEKVEIYVDGVKIYSRPKFEVVMHKIRVNGDDVQMRAFLKSPVYSYLPEKAHIYAVENDDMENKKLLTVIDSVHSYYKSNTKTCNFYSFVYHCDASKVNSFKFMVELDGTFYDTEYWCMPVAVFSKQITSYIRGNVKLTLTDNVVSLNKVSDEEKERFCYEQTEIYSNRRDVYYLRKLGLDYKKEHRVWLYYDLHTVDKDNGYYQFINDFEHKDGVERYYVYDRDLSEIEHLFTEEQKRYLVAFGSSMHKMLYLSAEKLLTAFYGFTTISPFETEAEEGLYLDIREPQIIYLQHGVLHAHLVIKNHAERCRAEKIVVSTPFEKQNYMENYGYEEEELICTGMARYDYIDREKKPKNKILFAPSWREYLTIVESGSQWELLENKVLSSDYYKKFMAFLSSPELYKALEENDMYLDFKLHPIIKGAKNLFNCENDRIRLAPESVDVEDYKIFVTDYSSFVFDFVYLRRGILYFVPDMDQFKSGMNHYRELDLPFEKAFGPLVLEPEDAVREVTKLIRQDGVASPLYRDRMQNFFFDNARCAEGLYQYLTK